MDNERAILAESTLIGCLISAPNTWDRIADMLTEVDFVLSSHRAIFSAIAGLAAKNDPYDAVSLADALSAKGALEEIGGVSVLYDIADRFTTAANIRHYAKLIRDQSVLRQVATIADEVAEVARSGEEGADDVLGVAQHRLGEISDQAQRGGPEQLRTVLGRVVVQIDERFNSDAEMMGVATGLADFDRMTSGLCEQDLCILAARPSMGKTALALGIADHVATKSRKPVLFFSLEMSQDAIGTRLLAMRARIDMMRLRTGKLLDEEWPRLTTATAAMADAPLYIDDSAWLSTTDMTARARRLARNADLSLVIVDYLQLIRGSAKAENRNIEVMRISQDLKNLAKSLKVPVLALSQLNRGVEQRPNKRPMMSDLRDSGGIEQDADLIMMLYRDEVYHKDSPFKGTAELIIAKQRNGPVGTCRLAFDGPSTRFGDLARGWQEPQPEPQKARPRRAVEY